jgi:hypothetical protein
MGGMNTAFWWDSQKVKTLLDVRGIILKWILERTDGLVCTGLILLRIGASSHGDDLSGFIKYWEIS